MNDLAYALRTLWKTPGFSIVAIATLALGIGASSAIFSVLEAVLLRPLPYPQQERIVELRELDEQGKGMPFAQPNYDDLRARSRSFAAIARYSAWPEAVAGGSEPMRTNVCVASSDFFGVLGIAPKIGRFYSKDERDSAVVSYAYWQRALGGRTNLEGTALRVGHRSFAVVGVLPAGSEFPPNTDVWSPAENLPPNESRTAHNWRVAGRLRADVLLEQSHSEIGAIGQELKRTYGRQTDAVSFGLTPLRERLVKDVRGLLWIICGAVGMLLVIACSNVANLLLVRATARRKEMALRAALGASRWRLARQFVAETILLTTIAGALGALLAFWGVQLIVGLYHGNLPRVGEIGVNASVLLFTLGVSLLVGLILGFVPPLHLSRERLQGSLQESGRGSSSDRSTSRVRNSLIVAQVALTLLLLIGAGLLGRSFQRLLQVQPGFRSESAVAMTVNLPDAETEAARRQMALMHQRLLERLARLPGTIAVGGINALPMSGEGANGTFLIEDGSKPAQTMAELSAELTRLAGSDRAGDAEYRAASADYFAAMGIPLVRGRFFETRNDPDAPHAALVSQTFVRRYWPNEEPLGHVLQFGNMDGDLRLLHVIGVVGDVRDDGLDTEPRPTIYVNVLQRPAAAAQFSIVLRAQGDAASAIAAMRREARAINPEIPLKFQTLRQVLADSLDQRRFSMVMLGIFAAAALVLAMVGLYGIMAYITAQRTVEIGIRMALGAQRAEMLRLIFRQSFVLVGAGMAAGILAALASTRLLARLLYGSEPTDLFTYGAVVLLLALAAILASYFPARRAMRVDPMVALRHE